MNTAPRSDDDPTPRATARLELDGVLCTVVCVDGVVPAQQPCPRGGRPRLVYAPGEIVHFVADGRRYAIVRESAAAAADDAGDGPAEIHRLLTNRELQIVQLICLGYLGKQVADRLGISEFTVRSYLKTIYAKLGVRSRGAMVYRYAQAVATAGVRVVHGRDDE